MSIIHNLMRRFFAHLGYLVEQRMLIRRAVIIALTIASLGYGLMGLWIMSRRPEGTITAEEAGIIIAFAGVNGIAFASYGKSRDQKQDEDEYVDDDYKPSRRYKK